MTAEQLKQLEASLWSAADNLRANSGLKSNEYATPILGLIFLKFADNKYSQLEPEITAEYEKLKGGRAERELHEIAVEKCGFYLPPDARYDYLLSLPESANIAAAIKMAMEKIEEYAKELKDCLPKDGYFALAPKDNSVLKRLLTTFANIPSDTQVDMFGQIYQYFLGKFALAEGQGGGEFFTPPSVVRLMVEIIEPHEGRVLDPACGSGGMFVQSARFIEARSKHGGKDRVENLFVCGQEKTAETVKLAKMNLVVNGLRGEIRQGSSYVAAESFETVEQFDYVMANPPFNVNEVEVATVINAPRFNAFGIPRNKTKTSAKKAGEADAKTEVVPNANYLWISLFATALKPKGRAALVMANSASDAQHTEAEIRQRLIEANLIYGMLALPSNMFYTVTLPATLWFFDKGKTDDKILFIDARWVFTQIDRAHREFSDDQVQNLAAISQLHRGERERFIERIDDCLTVAQVRLGECPTAFSAVWDGLVAAVPPKGDKPDAIDAAADAIDNQAERIENLLKPEVVPAGPSPVAEDVDARNTQQQAHVAALIGYFKTLQEELKALDAALRAYEKAVAEKAEAEGKRRPQDRKLSAAKAEWEKFVAQVQAAADPLTHARWLQERFPEAKYADVVGLCKLASREEVSEQDYSLNPGRYVGVVIEEDGKTPEEFRADLSAMNAELEKLNTEAQALVSVISQNVAQLVGAE